jgi:uncharacterized protein YhaN
MRIEGWHIEGFGALHDVETSGLPDGVTVFLGQNEAGKSTLLAFLRAVLFGFPDRRTRENLYPPLTGGRHGGTVLLREGNAVWSVSRYADKRGSLTVRGPGGQTGDESDLRRLLAGVDATLFKSVYAFSLSELQAFATLNAEGVRERIFSVGISGAGLSARAVLKQLADEESELLKQRAGQARINVLVRRVHEARDAVRRAEDAARSYPEILAREAALSEQVDDLESSLRRLATERRRFETLDRLFPERQTLDELDDLVSRLPQPASADQPAIVEALLRRLPVLRSNAQRLDELRVKEVAARRDLELHLQRLGPDWAVARLSGIDDSLAATDAVREWRRLLDAADGAATQAVHIQQERGAALEDLTADHQRCSLELPPDPPPSAAALSAREAGLRGLRAQIKDLQMAELSAQSNAPPRTWSGARLALGGAVVLLLASAAAGLGGASQLAVGLAVGAVALLAIALLGRPFRGADSRPGDSPSADALSRQRAQVTEESARLGFSAVPADAELSAAEARVSTARGARIACDGTEKQLRELEARIHSAERQLDTATKTADKARRELDALRAGWTHWLTERDLPAISPEGTIQFFDEVRSTRLTKQALEEAEAEIARIETERAEWSGAARAALVATVSLAPTLPEADLEAALEVTGDGFARRDAALERRAACRRRLDAGLAELGDPETGEAELSRGDPSLWRAEIDRLTTEVTDVETLRTASIEERRDARRERERLEISADVPRLQGDLESLRAELAVSLQRYRVVRTASGLIQTTLEGYVRDRQPGVLARASAAFAAVTEGRFRAVVQDAGADSDTVLVEQWDGARFTPDQLSRGTGEQLYLAIRLALVEEFAERGHALPMIMDDCLVNFDPQRAAAMARLIAASAARGQCLFFTCHPVTASLFTTAAHDPTQVVRLPGRTGPSQAC